MSKGPLGRRVALCVAVAIAVAVPALGSGTAFGDQISDKRAEAARVADQVEALQAKAEVIAEDYNNAQLVLATVNRKAAEAKARSARTQVTLAKRRKEMSGYAVSAYMRGGTGTDPALILTSGNGNDIGQRKGYAAAAAGQSADAVDRLRAATASAQADMARLATAKAKVSKVRAEVEVKRQQANAAVDAANHVLDKVQGQLRTLVQAEQARRAAIAAAAARAAASRFAAQQAAYAAAHPSATRPSQQGAGTGGAADTGGSSSADGGTTSDVAPPVGVGADAAIAAARSVLGVRYTWAGASPSGGFDCSGLVMWAWQHGGKSLPHSSAAMYSSSRRIPLSEMQPGDLVFYGSPVHHVALYIGGGQIIHAPHTGSYVQVASVNYWSDIRGAGRV